MENTTAWFMWPFVALARLVAVILGIVLMLLGVILTMTVLGAILGIPVFVLGLLLVFRGLF